MGVDGSGKSSTIELLREIFPEKEIYHYHNLPISHKSVTKSVDAGVQHFGDKRLGRLVSEIKVIYKIGQFLALWVYRFRIIYDRNTIIIVDRVISDMFVDKRRYRLHENSCLTKLSLVLLSLFDYVLVLDADVKVILERNSENSPKDVIELRKRYLELTRMKEIDIIKTDVTKDQTKRMLLELFADV